MTRAGTSGCLVGDAFAACLQGDRKAIAMHHGNFHHTAATAGHPRMGWRHRVHANLVIALPKFAPLPKQTVEQLQKLEAGLRERDEKLSAVLAG